MTRSTLSSRSKKEDIWRENQRLEQAAREVEQRALVLERELADARTETGRLRERVEFVEVDRHRLQGTLGKLEGITRLTKEITSLDAERIFEVSVTKVPFIVGARLASIWLLDEDRKTLALKRHNHARRLDPVVRLNGAERSLMAIALARGDTLVIPDLDRVPGGPSEPQAERPNAGRYETRSCIVAPLRATNRVVGVLNLADPFEGEAFDPQRDLPLVRQIADLLAISLRNYQLFEQVQRMAKTDPLTQLANHQAFIERLQVEVRRAERYGSDLSLLLVDIDGFQLLNENYGHPSGDSVLEEMARLVRQNVRDVDLVGRYGPDEFAVLLPEQTAAGAQVVAERMVTIARDHRFPLAGKGVPVTVSVGIAVFGKGLSPSELVKRADEALVAAKRDRSGFVTRS